MLAGAERRKSNAGTRQVVHKVGAVNVVAGLLHSANVARVESISHMLKPKHLLNGLQEGWFSSNLQHWYHL